MDISLIDIKHKLVNLSFLVGRMVYALILVILVALVTIVPMVTTNTLRTVTKRVEQVLITPQQA